MVDALDDFDYLERSLSGDDEMARRVLSLAIEFMNAKTPISSEAIYTQYYPTMEQDTAIKAFSRDRDRLAQCGIVLERSGLDEHDNSLWSANAQLSFVQNPVLSEDDALLVDLLCLPLVEDLSFALRHELKIALAKIDSSFARPSAARLSLDGSSYNRILMELKTAALKQKAVAITYIKADGTCVERTIAPYGFFGLRDTVYVVAPRLDSARAPIHTYNVSRITKASLNKSKHFNVPSTFDVHDYLKLPFQMGAIQGKARFFASVDQEQALRQASRGLGSITSTKDGFVLEVDYANVEDAAAWAVSNAFIPLAPKTLVDAWHACLEGVVA